jgi:hypothetical protein
LLSRSCRCKRSCALCFWLRLHGMQSLTMHS